jgi:endonuclease V-like protein UPF0215 family
LPKREIRILGLALSYLNTELQLVGVILRGNQWLDGILVCTIDPNEDYISEITRTILKSKQYSQIRVVVSRENLLPKRVRDMRKLSLKTRLPMILLTQSIGHTTSAAHIAPQPNRTSIEKGRRKIMIRTIGLNACTAREILLIGCRGNLSIPEALRIAELITIGLKSRI